MILLVKISILDQVFKIRFSFTHRSFVALADFVPNLGSKAYANRLILLLYTHAKSLASSRFSVRIEYLLKPKPI